MTVPATTRRAGPFTGNGVATSFPFTFKTFDTGDLAVTLTDADALESTLVLDSDYSVTLNGDQDASPGGSITYPISGAPLASGEKLTVVGAVDYDQTADLPTGGSFSPVVIENALDRATFQIQQLAEELGRSLTLPASAAGADTTLPAPEANKIIGWDEAANALVNYAPADFATVVVNGTSYTDVFSGTGAQTAFALQANPGSVNALDIAISGVSQVNGVDFAVSGTTLTFTSAPPAGTGNICVRYVAAVPIGSANAQDVSYNPAASYPAGTVGASLKRQVYATDIGVNALGNYDPIALTGADDTAALQAGLDLAGSRTSPPTVTIGMHGLGLANAQQGTFLLAPGKNYKITQPLKVPPGVTFDLNGSFIWQTGTGDAVQLLYQGLGYSFYGRFYDCVRNGTIMGPGAGTSTGSGLFIDIGSGGVFERLLIQGFRYGRKAWELQYSTFTDVRCFYNQVGGYFTARPTDTTLTTIDNAHYNCSDANNTIYGLWLQCDSYSHFSRHDSSRNGVCDVLLGGQLTGQLRTFTVSSGGSGYPVSSVIAATITDGTGVRAQAYAETNGSGVVTGVFSVDAGSDYTAPTITIPGGGVAAVVTSTPVTDTVGDWAGSSVISRGRLTIEVKVEHTDADRPLSGYAVIINDNTQRQSRFPNLSVARQGVTNRAYYRWLLNLGRGNVVEFPGDPSNNPSAISRPGAATDVSIFRSTTAQGLTVVWGGSVDGDKIPRYGVDASGAVDYAANIFYAGFTGNGEFLSTWYMAETSFSQGVVYKGRVTADANNRLEIGVDGTIKVGAGSTAPSIKARLTTVGVSADRGDASVTLVAGTDDQTQRFATALTVNRTVTLSGTGAVKGDRFRVVRTGLGAFTLDVGGLKTVASATAAWVDVEHDGTAWRLTGYGAL